MLLKALISGSCGKSVKPEFFRVREAAEFKKPGQIHCRPALGKQPSP